MIISRKSLTRSMSEDLVDRPLTVHLCDLLEVLENRGHFFVRVSEFLLAGQEMIIVSQQDRSIVALDSGSWK